MDRIARLLKAHTTIEEEVFYPAFRDAGGKKEEKMYFEALEEHRAVDDLVLPDLQKTEPRSVQFSGRAKVLKELIEHHAEEEEEEMFPKAKKLFDKEELKDLGARMLARKDELLAVKSASGLPPHLARRRGAEERSPSGAARNLGGALEIAIRILAAVGGFAILWWSYRALAPGFIDIPPDRVTGDPGGPPPAESLSAHLDVPLVEGNRIELLVNGDQIFPAMLGAIDAAEESVNLLSFVYWTGDIARRFAAVLARAAQRGVDVRVVLDAVGAQKMDPAVVQSMREGNVRVAWFNPVRWYSVKRLNHRTHRKVMVVDGRIGFTGGVGIGEEWTGDATDPDHWRDDHFRLEGPVVRYLQGAFAENWRQATGEVLAGTRVFPPLEPVGDVPISVINTGPGGATSEIGFSYWLTFRRARERVWISTPYFAPDPDLDLGLADAARRGVDVRLLVPGPYQDSRMVRYASQTLYRDLIAAGVKLYEFQPTMLHVKSVSVDREWSMVGSANFDSRSFEINFETVIAAFDREFTEALDASFEADLGRAKQITREEIEARPWFVELRNRAARIFREQL